LIVIKSEKYKGEKVQQDWRFIPKKQATIIYTKQLLQG